MVVQFEWLIILLIGLAFLVWELVRVRRMIRRDREEAAAREPRPE